MGEESSTITFQSVYDMVRKEKTSEEIQQLNPEVFLQLTNYLKIKIQIYKNSKNRGLNPGELEKMKVQIVSARKLIKELYERRERKILQLAINKSRTKSDTIDDSNLLKEEKLLFNDTTEVLDKYRQDILLNLVNARLPFGKKEEPQIIGDKEENKEETNTVEESSKIENEETMTIRFTRAVPKFLGLKEEIYGPFEPGDTVTINKEIANVIIKRGRGEPV